MTCDSLWRSLFCILIDIYHDNNPMLLFNNIIHFNPYTCFVPYRPNLKLARAYLHNALKNP
jgi:hypothetical protein